LIREPAKTAPRLWLGIDVGSVSLKLVLLTAEGTLTHEKCVRLQGQPLLTARRELGTLIEENPGLALAGAGLTGSGGALLARLLGLPAINEIVALSRACGLLFPSVRTLIDIGGEDSKLLLFRSDPDGNSPDLADFAMNSICAAGTGSFLDQQAARLGLGVEELGRLGLQSRHPPRVAGRCSVFAKTDMIHLQQEGAKDCEIVAGLLFAMARNFKSTVARGKTLTPPILFTGGVAANQGMVRALREILEAAEEDLIVPGHFAFFGAAGAALLARDENGGAFRLDLSPLDKYLASPPREETSLARLGGEMREKTSEKRERPSSTLREGYLGIDIGSISTKAAVIGPDGSLAASVYLRTAGRPLLAAQRVIADLGRQLPAGFQILGAASTGSGRYLIGDFIGADEVKNEISAQARAAAVIDPSVDTIFEIGGQDSKYIRLEEGAVVDFEMNKVCAAGTGSFLEEQAEKLAVRIEEFGDTALAAPAPVALGERCTVFMESDLLHHQQNAARRDDLVAGLAYSIALNYLNRVVGRKKVGKKIFFQGAVAFNAGVAAAFGKVLGRPVAVPPHPHLTGAIGAALWAKAKREREGFATSCFKGFAAIAACRWEQSSFECTACPNRCSINRVVIPGSEPLCYGSRCEKFDGKSSDRPAERPDLPDLFAESARMSEESIVRPQREGTGRRIGLPRAILNHELLPLWETFFRALGCRVVVSDPTDPAIIAAGVSGVTAETCYPMKLAHGHVQNLLGKGIDSLFLPTLINLEREADGWNESFNCPYVQVLSSIIAAAVDLEGKGVAVLSPVIAFGWRGDLPEKSLLRVGRALGMGRAETKRAARTALAARAELRRRQLERGRELLSALPPEGKAAVIVSRSYNSYDPALNVGLPRTLRKLGILAIPVDFLPLGDLDLSDDWPNMYWRSGQKLLQAARFIRRDPRLFAISLSNFGCGPDSFIQHYFAKEMEGKPYLQIEVDEHSADVGAVTRCEAFWDSVSHARVLPPPPPPPPPKRGVARRGKTTVFIPYMSDASYIVAAAFAAEGFSAKVFPRSNQETLTLGKKFTSGKECFPCVVTTGDMVRITRDPSFRPEASAFFMPSTSGPCRFGQYCRLQRMVLDSLGHSEVPILAPSQDSGFYGDLARLGAGFFRKAWRGLVAVDLLDRIRRENRPYEEEKGKTDQAYRRAVKILCRAVESGGNISRALAEGLTSFDGMTRRKITRRPVIGIVGEIFVRNHPFSNDEIVRQIEDLGGEADLPPVREWVWHLNREMRFFCSEMGMWGGYFKALLTGWLQRHDEKRLIAVARPYLRYGSESTIDEIWRNASRYLPPWFGEAALSAGKSVEYARENAAGIVNVMPFTCMPGTIFASVLHRLRRDHGGIPALTLAFDGLKETSSRARLEAFMHQARRRHSSNTKRSDQ
jgi:predicted CoA-substrate-specific enzyme activase